MLPRRGYWDSQKGEEQGAAKRARDEQEAGSLCSYRQVHDDDRIDTLTILHVLTLHGNTSSVDKFSSLTNKLGGPL